MRQRPTTTDYMLAGIAPAMIIGMINCLVFFLITVVYRGDFNVRLMYILGLYTFGSVLIARIAIEQSRALATTYTSIIGLATLFVVMQFVEFKGAILLSFPIVVGFLVLIGFLADRITFDCTLIDEKQDASGEGLLQSLGMLHSKIRTKKKRHNPGVWVLYFSLLALPLFGLGQLAIPATEVSSRAWAFWFLFGYLLFGLSLLLATSFLGLRRYLRQRQVAMPASMARVWMMGGSLGIVGLLLVATILPLPGRSAGLISLPAYFTSPTNLQASRFGWGKEGTQAKEDSQTPSTDETNEKGESDSDQGKGPPQSSEKKGDQPSDSKKSSESETSTDDKNSNDKNLAKGKGNGKQENGNPSGQNQDKQPKENQPNKNQPSDNQPSDNQPSDKQPSDKQPSDKQPSDKQPTNEPDSKKQRDNRSPDEKTRDASDPQSKQSPSTSSQSNPWRMPDLGGLPNIIKWITIAVLCSVILIYLVLHGSKLLDSLRALFGTTKDPNSKAIRTSTEAVPTPKVARPFASFSNPFAKTGSPMNPSQVIRHTFEAVQAWGLEHSVPRGPQETPEEYLMRLSKNYATQAETLNQLAVQYNSLAYSNVRKVNPSDATRLQQLWTFLYKESN